MPVIIIPLVFSHATVDFVLLPKYLLYAFFVLVISLVADQSIYHRRVNLGQILNSPFFLFYFLFSLQAFIGLLFTVNFSDGLFEWLKMCLFGIAVLCCTISFYEFKNLKDVFTKAVTMLNVIIVLIGLIQFIIISQKANITYNSTYQMSATFAHKNIFLEILFLTFPFVLYNVFCGNKFWKIVSLILAILSLFLITVALTRSVWLATFGGFIIAFPIYILYNKNIPKGYFQFKNRKNLLVVLALAFSIIAGVIIYSKVDSFSTVLKQTFSISGHNYGSGGERIQLWKKSYEVFKEAPLLGSGMGSWKIKTLKYGHQGLETEDNKTYHQRPHNDFIWILCEQGVIGLVLYLFFVSLILFYLFRLIRKTENHQDSFFYFLCFYAYMGYLIYSFFSFPRERIEHNVLLMFIFSITIIDYQKRKKKSGHEGSNKLQHLLFLLLAAISIFSIYVGISRFNSEVHLRKAYTARSRSQWKNVISEIEKAENGYYKIDPMCTPLKWYSGSAYFNMGNTNAAYDDFYASYQLNPNHVHVLNNLATCLELKGKHQEAIGYYKQALEISPHFIDAQLNLSAIYFNLKEFDQAYNIFKDINADSTSEKYFQMRPLIVRPIIKNLADSIENSAIKQKILSIYKDPRWSVEMLTKSRLNNISIQKQTVLDAIFILGSLEKKFILDDINTLKKKYNIVNNP